MKILSFFLVITILTTFVACGGKAPESSEASIVSSQESSLESSESPEPDVSPEPEVSPESEPVAESISPEDILGRWDYIYEDKGEKFIMWLNFIDEKNVEYVVGWYQSEAHTWCDGEYTLEDGKLLLHNLIDRRDSTISITNSYEITLGEKEISLTYIDGDRLVHTQVEEPMVMPFSDSQ